MVGRRSILDTWVKKRLKIKRENKKEDTADCLQFKLLLKGEKRKSGSLERHLNLGMQRNGRALAWCVQGCEFILQYRNG